jgi:adenylate cyclase 1
MTHDARYRHYQPQQQTTSNYFNQAQQQQMSLQQPHQQFYHPQYQQQNFAKKQTNSAPYRYNHTSNNSNNNGMEVYMKPLPQLPIHNENESREMSSTDDLSQSEHRQSLSVDSSSDESYSKTDDFDQSNLKLDMPPPRTSAAAAAEYQRRMPALKDLQDYEISSTTDHTVSTLPPNKGESCNSFEFQNNDKRESQCKMLIFTTNFLTFFSAYPKSPFERELQRLLSESAKNKLLAVNKTNNLDTTSSGKHKKSANNGSNNNNNNNTSNGLYGSKRATSSSAANGNNNNINDHIESESLKQTMGLEAVKEITKLQR